MIDGANLPDGRRFSTGSSCIFPLVRHCPLLVTDPFDLYVRLTGCSPHSFFLEQDDAKGGVSRRVAYLGSDPYEIVRGREHLVEVWRSGEWTTFPGHPFEWLCERFRGQPPQVAQKILPFQGGAIGCLSYDLARSFECLPSLTANDLLFPDVYCLLVETFVVVDCQSPGAWLVYAPSPERMAGESWEVLCREGAARLAELEAKLTTVEDSRPGSGREVLTPRIFGEQSEREYRDRVQECQEFIAAGDIYQANLSHRFRIEGLTEAFPSAAQAGAELFRKIRQCNPSPHAAFLVLEKDVIVSNSPERLVRLTDGHADMRPIAGTRPRGLSDTIDRRLAEELLSDVKERAEHLMLVDLVRNDLGRVCEYGTVRVDEFMTIERYSHVMHLVSNVSGRLGAMSAPWDLIRAVFPGGTISGVPKVRCMELIERLEPVRRGLYTGSIGFMGWNGNMDWNIAIRTLVLRGAVGFLQVGAGIVADSVPKREYEETLHKAEAFFKVLRGRAVGSA